MHTVIIQYSNESVQVLSLHTCEHSIHLHSCHWHHTTNMKAGSNMPSLPHQLEDKRMNKYVLSLNSFLHQL